MDMANKLFTFMFKCLKLFTFTFTFTCGMLSHGYRHDVIGFLICAYTDLCWLVLCVLTPGLPFR